MGREGTRRDLGGRATRGRGPEPPPPRATFAYLGIPSEADLNPFLPPPVVSKAREAVPSSLTTFRRPGLRPDAAVAATVAAAGADSAHSAPSLQPAQFGQPRSGRTLGSIHSCLSFTLRLPLLHSSNTSLSVVPFHHIRIGMASNSWQEASRLGAARPGLGPALPCEGICLGQEARAGPA